MSAAKMTDKLGLHGLDHHQWFIPRLSTGIRYGADFVGYGPDKPLYTTLGARLVRLDAGNTPVPLRLLVGVQDAKKTTLPLISTDPRPNSLSHCTHSVTGSHVCYRPKGIYLVYVIYNPKFYL
uniref:Uncharacterized protein n=1 Tax=Hyaloperonospora arabidopsidis (strain Emoy2) TaxID=559515 RepID=M4BW15_HYAAE